jgi:NhaP-type Na+/H+ or K+/H+ antiporter
VLAAPDAHAIGFAVAGLAVLGGALWPVVVRNRPLSTPILSLLLGIIAFALPTALSDPDPLRHVDATEILTEVGVIVSLMGAGLKLDRPIGWRRWAITWRLLAITLPLSVVGVALLGWWGLALAPASALLLGAVLAPTDPVLAADVQVGPPGERTGEGDDAEDEVRFSLTSEAGLNDALAFPFTNAAVAVALAGGEPTEWLLHWLSVDVVYKLVVGLAGGVLIGRLLGRLTFALPQQAALASQGLGFVALTGTFLSYGATEVVGGYGFLAVFVTAVTYRAYERDHAYHQTLHDFTEQIEHLLTIGLLVLLGGAIAGGLLAALTWQAALVALAVVFVVRPITVLAGLGGTDLPSGERAAIAFFGIRGIGSLYYLAYALNAAPFEGAELLWATVAFAVVSSVLVHGVLATPVMRRLDVRRELVRASAT